MEFARHGLAGDFVGNRMHLVSGDVQSGGGPAAHIETDAHEALEIAGNQPRTFKEGRLQSEPSFPSVSLTGDTSHPRKGGTSEAAGKPT